MAVNQRLELRQRQTMVMTPQLQQSIKLLQLPTIELEAYLLEELEKNPLLTLEGDGEEEALSLQAKEKELDAAAEDVVAAVEALSETPTDIAETWVDEAVSPAVYEEEDNNLSYAYTNSGRGEETAGSFNFEEITPDSGETLREHILDQIHVDVHEPKLRLIASQLADLLDENGYLTSDLEKVAENLKCTRKDIDKTLKILKNFDPPGVFAKDLAECLSLQLKDRNHLDPAIKILLEHLDLVAKRDYKALKRLCDVSDEDLQHMLNEIRALNPRPGTQFNTELVQVVQPDVYLKRTKKGDWQVELNTDTLPKVLVNRRYYSIVSRQVAEKKDKTFLQEQFNAANWLVKALNQRAETILKVATEIVAQQDAFFREGIQHFKAMTLADIARQVEVHESTVSRVVNGKYMATPMGLFELKYFFSSAVPQESGGEGISSRTIKHRIKALIDGEDPKKPLSDDKLVTLLKKEGVEVARRTVAKYREALRLGSSAERKRMKKG